MRRYVAGLLAAVLVLFSASSLFGCVNENSEPYTAEQAIQQTKSQLKFDADIVCVDTTIVNEAPWKMVTYTLYDRTNDFEFSATASVHQAEGDVLPLPNRRELSVDYFDSYLDHLAPRVQALAKEKGVVFSPASDNHSGYDTIIVSSEDQLQSAAELFDEMVHLYNLDQFDLRFGRDATNDICFAYLAPEEEDFAQKVVLGYYKAAPLSTFYEDNTDAVGSSLFSNPDTTKSISENLLPHLERRWQSNVDVV